ncbi:MAG: hypothetical protein F4X57_05630 [Chloroflexi bacterium]|nr:hypothetical protein [Chloroflexota bacterium]
MVLPAWVRVISVAAFVVSFIGGMTLVAWYEIAAATAGTTLATTIAIISRGESVSVVSAGIAGAFEGGAYIMVIAYEMVKRGFDRGYDRGKEEGIEEGKEVGREEGVELGVKKGQDLAYADADAQNLAYYKRMREALERGEDFDEPPPTFRRNGKHEEEQE